MTITKINSHNNHKLSIYLSQHLKDKRYTKGQGKGCLEFTFEEAREALMSALRVSYKKKDILLFLQQLRRAKDEK